MAVIVDQNGAVLFDYMAWTTAFPIFQDLSQDTAEMYWRLAGNYLNNTARSACTDPQERSDILSLITAHIAQIFASNAASSGDVAGGPQLSGRLQSVTQGSVSLSVAPLGDGTRAWEAWFNQTTYGSVVWGLLQRYLLARAMYRPRPFLGSGRFPQRHGQF